MIWRAGEKREGRKERWSKKTERGREKDCRMKERERKETGREVKRKLYVCGELSRELGNKDKG